MMWRIKELADPDGVLNPGVVLNRDPGVHLRNLKTQPAIEEAAAHCVECGFCEPVCPSRNATTTPRQRIVIRRELARQPEGSPVYEALLADFEHDAIQTCAADGSCQAACPVAIDTGKLIKDFRRRERTAREERVALSLAKRYAVVERLARGGLRGAALGGARGRRRAVAAVPNAVRRRVSADLVPALPASLPPAAPAAAARAPRATARPPSTCRPASTGSSATRRQRRRAVAARGAVRAVRARRRAAVDPARRRRQLLRDAVGSKGYARGPREHGAAGRPSRSCAGARRASCRS